MEYLGVCLFYLLIYLFQSPHISDTIRHLSFFVWLSSRSIMPSGFTHVVTNGTISFFVVSE